MQNELSTDTSPLTTVAAGLAAALAGALVGFMVGANIGGNWFTSFTLGSLHGYEATAWLGAAAGALGAGVVTVLLTRRGSRSRRRQRAG